MRICGLIFLSQVATGTCQWGFYTDSDCMVLFPGDVFTGSIYDCHQFGDNDIKTTCSNGNYEAYIFEKGFDCEEPKMLGTAATGTDNQCSQWGQSESYFKANCSNNVTISTGAIIGIVIGSIVFLVILLLIIRRYRSSNEAGSFTLINML